MLIRVIFTCFLLKYLLSNLEREAQLWGSGSEDDSDDSDDSDEEDSDDDDSDDDDESDDDDDR